MLGSLNRSLDVVVFGGREVFGRNKTLRGMLVVPLACAAGFGIEDLAGVAPLFSPLAGGFVVGLAYVAFELPNSFLKRRLNIAPGAGSGPVFFALDHLDSALGCAIAFLALGVAWPVVATGLVLGPLIHTGVNRFSHASALRETAW